MQEAQETWVQSLGWEDPLEEDMATHTSILAWRIPCTEEPGQLQFIGSQGGRDERTEYTGIFLKLVGISIGFLRQKETLNMVTFKKH